MSDTKVSDYGFSKNYWENDITKKFNFKEMFKTDTLKIFSKMDFLRFDLVRNR